jgi:DNA-binding transcriptional MerR regulator
MTELPMYLNQSEVAKALGVSRLIIQRAEKRGYIRGIREGNQKLYSRADVIDLALRRNSR